MKRDGYLGHPEVSAYCDWLASNLTTQAMAHGWVDRRTNQQSRFPSLYAARLGYDWDFSTVLPPNASSRTGRFYGDNESVLGELRDGIRAALAAGDPDETYEWSVATVKWGGVLRGNGHWLGAHRNNLVDILTSGRALLEPEAADDEHLGQVLRFSSGLSKIYSLLMDDFVIYDSRVAAGIGWSIVKYCEQRNLQAVPNLLCFHWAPPYEAKNARSPKNRNPSQGALRFQRIQPGEDYAVQNLRASWLLKDAAQRASLGPSGVTLTSRELEAAFFMIGYDLGSQPVMGSGRRVPAPDLPFADRRIANGAMRTRGTRSKCKEFYYWFESDSIGFENENAHVSSLRFTALARILLDLQKQFEKCWFPLANDFARVRNGKIQPGLGTTVTREGVQSRDASYWGPILEDLEFLEWNGNSNSNMWRLAGVPSSQDSIVADLRELASHQGD